MQHYRSVWISDVHLGTKGCSAEVLLAFLRTFECDTLYIVGDLIDIWALRRSIFWPQSHNDVLQKILRKGRKGSRIVYIPGNHDEFVAGFCGDYGSISIQKSTIHTTADDRRLLIIHGHELDAVVQNIKWLAHLGDVGYKILLTLNHPVNVCRRFFGLRVWSLSAWVKRRVKDAVSFIGKFEEAIVHFAEQDGVDGVLCGHIHSPAVREISGYQYLNCGDWVESRSALVEHYDGRLELITDFQDAEEQPVIDDENEESEDMHFPEVMAALALRGLRQPSPLSDAAPD